MLPVSCQTMSFNKILSHIADGYAELVVDGYEDWSTAVDSMTELANAAEVAGLTRFLIDFRRVDMRISINEVPDIALYFKKYCLVDFDLAVILPQDTTASATARAFAETIAGLGHDVAYVVTSHERVAWVARRHCRAGAA